MGISNEGFLAVVTGPSSGYADLTNLIDPGIQTYCAEVCKIGRSAPIVFCLFSVESYNAVFGAEHIKTVIHKRYGWQCKFPGMEEIDGCQGIGRKVAVAEYGSLKYGIFINIDPCRCHYLTCITRFGAICCISHYGIVRNILTVGHFKSVHSHVFNENSLMIGVAKISGRT